MEQKEKGEKGEGGREREHREVKERREAGREWINLPHGRLKTLAALGNHFGAEPSCLLQFMPWTM